MGCLFPGHHDKHDTQRKLKDVINERTGCISGCRTNQKAEKKKGLSQEEMAYDSLLCHCSISSSSIKRAELGRKVSYRTARNISKYLEVELDVLLLEPDVIAMAAEFISGQADGSEVVWCKTFNRGEGKPGLLFYQLCAELLENINKARDANMLCALINIKV